jgi:hypothetical protein
MNEYVRQPIDAGGNMLPVAFIILIYIRFKRINEIMKLNKSRIIYYLNL